MPTLLIPVVIVAAIGLIAGLGLAIASIVMAVPVNEKEQAILEALPGANCGSCGYSGCAGYAAALAKGEAEGNLCSPGGAAAANKIAAILGVAAGEMTRKTACVRCVGNNDNTGTKYTYSGERTCFAAAQLGGGPQQCSFGCIGFGDCVNVCDYDAIQVCNGVAAVNPDNCVACGKCKAACPKGLIDIVPVYKEDTGFTTVLCQNHDKGGVTRKICQAGCIGCMRCVKACEFGAVSVENNLARVDYAKCTLCGKCLEVCAPKCITLVPLAR